MDKGSILCIRPVSSPVRTLGSLVRIPLEAWISLYVCSMLMLSCEQEAALRRADPPSMEPYRLYMGLRNRKGGESPAKGCRAIDSPFPYLGDFKIRPNKETRLPLSQTCI
jgi:hypothetical protein